MITGGQLTTKQADPRPTLVIVGTGKIGGTEAVAARGKLCTGLCTDLSASQRTREDLLRAAMRLRPSAAPLLQTFKTGEAWQPHAG